jgi:biotin operon repressor
MSVLSILFGDCPQLKIVETFAENYKDKLYIADIARMTGVSKVTILKHIRTLQEEGVIIRAGNVGKVQYYQLNMENQKVKIILLLEQYMISEKLEEMIKKD